MRNAISIGAKSCCSDEKNRLMDALYACDYCTQSLEERHQCYRQAARDSGRRARECLRISK